MHDKYLINRCIAYYQKCLICHLRLVFTSISLIYMIHYYR